MAGIDRVGGSEPLYNPPRINVGAPAAAEPAPSFGTDSFSRIRPRTPEQASGMKALDAPAKVSMGVGGTLLAGGLVSLASFFLGTPLLGAFSLTVGIAAAALGAVTLGFALVRWLSRKDVLEQG